MYADNGVHLEEAVDLLLRAVALKPDNSAFLDSLGWAFFRLGDLKRAKDYLDKALELLDGSEVEEKVVILDHAGDVALALGRRAEARAHWQEVLELMPGNEDVKGKLDLTQNP